MLDSRAGNKGLLFPVELVRSVHKLLPSQPQGWEGRAWNWGGKRRGALGRQRGGDLVWEGRDGRLNGDRWPREVMVVGNEFA